MILSASDVTLIAPKYILHCTSHVRGWLWSPPNPGGGLTFGRWWSLVSLSTRRNSTRCPSVNPVICTGACGGSSAGAGGGFPVVLASPGFVGCAILFLLVIVAGIQSSDPSGDTGSGVVGLTALESLKMFCKASASVLVLISSSVRSISPSWSVVLSVC